MSINASHSLLATAVLVKSMHFIIAKSAFSLSRKGLLMSKFSPIFDSYFIVFSSLLRSTLTVADFST